MDRSYPKDIPPMWFAIAIGGMIALHRWIPVVQCPWHQRIWIAYAVIACGVILGVSSAAWFRRRGTPVRPFSEAKLLVTDGAYRFTRNPMYLGLTIALIGIWMRLGSLTPGIVIVLFVWLVDRRFIVREESMLTERFGEEYVRFTERVRRWI